MGLSFAQLLANIQKRIGVEAIDQFRDHLESSLNKRRKSVEKDYESLSEDMFENPFEMEQYKSVLDDEFYMLDEVKKLSNEFLILGLFKQVEIHNKQVIKRHLSSIDERKLFNFKNLKELLPFSLESVNEFDSFNELRLINNSIKHNAVVSKELAREFSFWKEDDELKELDIIYDRLLPKIKIYVSSFVDQVANNSELTN